MAPSAPTERDREPPRPRLETSPTPRGDRGFRVGHSPVESRERTATVIQSVNQTAMNGARPGPPGRVALRIANQRDSISVTQRSCGNRTTGHPNNNI